MATTKKVKTEKYIVVKRHTLGLEIGDKCDLTEAKASALVGKVRKASEVAGDDENKASASDVKKLKAAEAKIAELEPKIENLEADVEALTAANAELKAQLKESGK